MVVLLMVLLAPLPLQDLAEEVGVDPMEEANIARLRTIVGATLDAAEESMQAKQQDTKEPKDKAHFARLRTIVGATLAAAEESMQAKQQDTM